MIDECQRFRMMAFVLNMFFDDKKQQNEKYNHLCDITVVFFFFKEVSSTNIDF